MSEVFFLKRVHPLRLVGGLHDATLGRLVDRARELLAANAERASGPERTTTRDPRTGRSFGPDPAPRAPLWVYHRAGRPCRRCGTLIRAAAQGRDLPRQTYWCPACQAGPADATP